MEGKEAKSMIIEKNVNYSTVRPQRRNLYRKKTFVKYFTIKKILFQYKIEQFLSKNFYSPRDLLNQF
jgi:hypothetical protein